MFRFANPEYLWLLLAIPFLTAFYAWFAAVRRKALKRYGAPSLLATLMPEVSVKRRGMKYFMLLAGLTAVVFVIAGPQFGSKLETVKRQGIEVMICLDVSNSMLAEDISPNRLEKAKQMLSRLTDDLNNDKLGLIVFAGEAFTQLPITSDYISAKMFMPSISPSMVSTQGTAIGSAIELAMRSFTPNEETSKAIIIITDGENHEGDAVQIAAASAEKGVKINVVGIGLPKGAPIPVGIGSDFLKDNSGNVVITQMNEQMCQDIAQAGQGMYVRADNTNSALKALQGELSKMSKSEVESQVYSDYDEQFPVLAWIALIIIVLEFFILERKNRLFRNVKLFS
ncbi:MAG: VWA domain-containing protein [Tannerella sp.]|jgi:Ca-activated chloride channel family protein|nr:VWA domain-containing protein [Tannerella sp.]